MYHFSVIIDSCFIFDLIAWNKPISMDYVNICEYFHETICHLKNSFTIFLNMKSFGCLPCGPRPALCAYCMSWYCNFILWKPQSPGSKPGSKPGMTEVSPERIKCRHLLTAVHTNSWRNFYSTQVPPANPVTYAHLMFPFCFPNQERKKWRVLEIPRPLYSSLIWVSAKKKKILGWGNNSSLKSILLTRVLFVLPRQTAQVLRYI